MKKTVIELFAGVGGFRVGLNKIQQFDCKLENAIENKIWSFVWANQWEPASKTQDAFNCYNTRFNYSESHSNEDISLVSKDKIPDHNLLVGGFPCQDYSVARTKSGEKGIEGKKGVLFWQIRDIIIAKNTPFILLENVDRLLKSPANQRGRDFGIMLRTLNDLGYNAEWRVINAAEYGCSQRRRRVFIFAWRKNLKFNDLCSNLDVSSFLNSYSLFAKSFPIQPDVTGKLSEISISSDTYHDTVEMTQNFKATFKKSGLMKEGIVYTREVIPVIIPPIMLKNVLEKYVENEKYFLTPMQIEKFKLLKNSKKISRKLPSGFEYTFSEGAMSFPDNLEKPGRTMLTSESSLNRSTHVVNDLMTKKLRFLTPVEAERLQGFPDNWTNTGMTDKKRYFMMGNALVTTLVTILSDELTRIFENEN